MQTITIIENDAGTLYVHGGNADVAWDAYEAEVGFGDYTREQMQADATTRTIDVDKAFAPMVKSIREEWVDASPDVEVDANIMAGAFIVVVVRLTVDDDDDERRIEGPAWDAPHGWVFADTGPISSGDRVGGWSTYTLA